MNTGKNTPIRTLSISFMSEGKLYVWLRILFKELKVF